MSCSFVVGRRSSSLGISAGWLLVRRPCAARPLARGARDRGVSAAGLSIAAAPGDRRLQLVVAAGLAWWLVVASDGRLARCLLGGWAIRSLREGFEGFSSRGIRVAEL